MHFDRICWQSWVTVTTALLSNLAAYNAYAPMEQRVQVQN